MKHLFSTYLFTVCLLLGICHISLVKAQITTGEFKNPPINYRPIPLWFWNNSTIQGEELQTQFQQMITKDGYGGSAILPFGNRFRPKYLSDEYFTLYGKAIEEAEKAGVKLSLYDEYGFPSGSMGAINGDDTPRFMNKYPDATIKRLDKIEYSVSSGGIFNQSIPKGDIMAVVAMDTITFKRISLRNQLQNGKVNWNIPQGAWKVFFFVCVKDGDPNVDYLSPDAVKLFIKETHESYYKHFPKAFGKTITTTFFDEPTMYRASGRIWTNDFNDKFIKQYGFSPDLLYPALWYNIGEDTAAARNYLFGFRSQLYAEGFMKTIQEWSEEHNIQSTGHQDQEEILNPVSVSGDLMLCGKYMGIPGIDKIGGGRPTEQFYKVVSSSAHNWDKAFVMSETYGAMGNISVKTLYQIAMEQYTKGINHLIPHAVWYNDQSVTFLPELSYRNPLYNKDLPEFNQFLSRLNYVLARAGSHVADIAMVYPIESLQAEHYLDGSKGYYEGGVDIPNVDYTHISTILTDSIGKDFTYLHPEVINDKCQIKNGKLILNNKINKEKYSILIIPGMKTISVANLKIIERFYNAGGCILFTTQLPEQSVEFGQNRKVKSIIQRMLNNNKGKGKTFFIPDPSSETIKRILDTCELTFDVAFTNQQPLNYIHKVYDDCSVYYFANLGESPRNSEIVLKGKINPVLFNPHTGETSKVSFNHQTMNNTDVTILTLPLQGNSSVFLIEQ
ncbi:glycosyl hydrolase [Bacteroides sp.]|uniref:glycosyl hydrolase n=1 Tax=Bacteroides sp. TaxID=29523 RepID=UPI002608297A|nr:glycosyl hydrolase [Bacteroides sp.]MDD3039439.1 glycosyl hydrolase [Bacteroides sp.]